MSQQAIDEEARQRSPDRPWMWRRDWREGRLRSSEGATAVLAWIFAIVFTAFSVPLLGVAADDVGERI